MTPVVETENVPVVVSDRVEEHEAIVGQTAVANFEEFTVIFMSDVFDHSDDGDAVEFFVEVAVIADSKFDRETVAEFSGVLDLSLRD